jgi:hypothetical protein
VPYAVGGKADIASIALVCRRHNVYLAELYFGSGPHATSGAATDANEILARTRSGTS